MSARAKCSKAKLSGLVYRGARGMGWHLSVSARTYDILGLRQLNKILLLLNR